MIRKFHHIVAAGASGASLALAASLPAGASTGPRLTSQEQAGYAASGARFRFVETTFTLPDATKFASEVGGLGVSVQLISSENTWMVLSFNTTTASGVYAASYANEFNAGQSIGASGALGANGWAKSGASVTLSIYYDRAGSDHLTAIDNTPGEAHFRTVAIPATSYTQARMVGLTGIHLTTYSGHRSGLVSWCERQKVFMVSHGVTQVEPHNLFATGRSFNVFMEPLPQ